MRVSVQKPDILPQRLCGEIQLFDLCDLDTCCSKNGRYCADPALLDRFEKIAEEELRTPERFVSEEDDENAEEDVSDDDGYDDDTKNDCDGAEDDGWRYDE